WIPPAHLLELRVLVRLGKTLVDQRSAFKQRLPPGVVYHRPPCPDHALLTQATRSWLEQVALPQASRLQVTTALGQIDQLDWSWFGWGAVCPPPPAASLAAGP